MRKRLVCIKFAFLVVMAACSGRAAMAGFVDQQDWYADGDAAIDGNGSAESPFNSLDSLDAAIEAGSREGKTAHLAGTFRGEQLNLINLTDCTFKQWDGRNPAVIRGDSLLTGRWIEQASPRGSGAGGVRYTLPLDPGPPGIVGVVEDWDIRIDPQGRHYGHLTEVTSVQQVELVDGSWHFDGANLHVHPTGGVNPNESKRVYGWCRGKDGTYLGDSTGCVFDGLTYQLWVDSAVGLGYALKIGSGQDCTIRNCTATDFGYHGFGFIGSWCVGNVFENCLTRGGRANGSTAYVFFASFQPVAGCIARDCTAQMYPLLNAFGEPLGGAGSGTHGFFTHSGIATLVTDVEFLRCDAFGYPESHAYAFSSGRFLPEPADLNDPMTYPVRCIECNYFDGASNVQQAASKIAFVRCFIDLSRLHELPGSTSAGMMTFGDFGPNRLLFQSCVIVTDTSGFSGRTLWRVAPLSTLTLQGCTVYDDGADEVNHRSFIRVSNSTSVVKATQTVFAHRVPSFLLRSEQGLASTANLEFDHGWYHNIRTADGFIQFTPLASQSAFQSVMDPSGVYSIDPRFAEVPFDLEGLAGSPISTLTQFVDDVNWSGINGQSYSGHYGAYQYGEVKQCVADLDASGVVDGLDLGILLASWSIPPGGAGCGGRRGDPGPGGCPADVLADGVVDGLDLGVLLAHWGPCP